MTRKVARAAPAGKRWGGSGGRVGSKRFLGRWRKGCRTSRNIGTAAPTAGRDLGLRRRRWVVRRASGLDGVTPFFPTYAFAGIGGEGFCVCGCSVFLYLLFSRFLPFFFFSEGGFFSTLISFP